MTATRKVVINVRFGGFGLSEAAYLKLAEWGVPIRPYVQQEYDPETKRWLSQPANDGVVIFDRLTTVEPNERHERLRDALTSLSGRYWDAWTRETRDHPLLVRVVEELGEAANGPHAKLKVVEIPADVKYTIEEYDGMEHVAEEHRTWN